MLVKNLQIKKEKVNNLNQLDLTQNNRQQLHKIKSILVVKDEIVCLNIQKFI